MQIPRFGETLGSLRKGQTISHDNFFKKILKFMEVTGLPGGV